uniref:Death effector domain-containing protein n=2 Tax=Passeriformes TaxID=9126 RepID=A0A8U7NW96_CORMO
MAGRKRRAGSAAAGVTGGTGGCGGAAPWPEEVGEREQGLYSLHRMFDIVGAQLTHRDVRVLSFLFVDVLDEAERGRIRSGRDFLLALERQGRCDESNLRQLLQLLRIITRHDLLPYVSLKRRRPVCPDLVDKYLEETSIRYVTPRAPGGAAPGLGHPHKSGTGPFGVTTPFWGHHPFLGSPWDPPPPFGVTLGSSPPFGVTLGSAPPLWGHHPLLGSSPPFWGHHPPFWGHHPPFGVTTPPFGVITPLLGSPWDPPPPFGVTLRSSPPFGVPNPPRNLCPDLGGNSGFGVSGVDLGSLGWIWGSQGGIWGLWGGFGVPRVGLGSVGWVWGLWDGFGVPRVSLGSQGGFGVPDPALSPVPAPHPSLCCSLGWVWGPRVGLGSQGGFGVPRVGLGSLGWVWGLWDGFGVPRVGLGSQDGFGVPDPAVSPVPAPHPSLCCSLGWVWGPRVGLGSQGGFGVPRVGLGSLGWVWGLWDGFGVPDPALSPVPAPHPSLCCSLGWVWGPRVGLGSQGGFGVPRVGLGSLGWVWGLWDGFGVPDPAVSPVPAPHPSLCCPPGGPQLGPKRPGRARSLLGNQRKRRKSATPDPKEKQTCDIRLRVRAEYCQHDSALHGNVFSNKQDPLERQFERFNQANTILKSRDLGSIICDIKFSELTYLDAFWRDYINGSLLEALKGVFITDSLKQAVGHEAIKLLVNVDEEDYELGRQKLLRNLMLHTAP